MLNIIAPANRPNLIIFIHGLSGGKETWVHKDETKTIYNYLRENQEISSIYDFGIFDYYSEITKPTNTFLTTMRSAINTFFGNTKPIEFNLSISGVADLLQTEIDERCTNYDNIVLIAHSMGVLVSKSYICKQLDKNKPLKISHFISLAVPHRGSNLATYAEKVLDNPQIKDLQPLNNTINKLNESWLKHAKNLPETKYFQGKFDTVVPQTSSIAYDVREDIEINYVSHDHFSILKPTADDIVLLGIKNFIKNRVKKKPKLLIPPIKPEKFRGRKKELDDLKSVLSANHDVVLVSGIGGIGKTSLLKEFFLNEMQSYDAAVFLEVKTNLETAFIEETHLKLKLQLFDKIQALQNSPNYFSEAFSLIVSALAEQTGNNLLCIDNLNDNLAEEIRKYLQNWKILCSSRKKLPQMKAFELDVLSTSDAILIFAAYFGLGDNLSESDTQIVTKIVEKYLANHTLAIEFVAKNAHESRWSLEKTLEQLQNKGLQFSSETDFTSDHSKQKTVENIFAYLIEIFPLEDIPDDEIKLLLHYSLMPNLPFDAKLWHNLTHINEESLINRLKKLHKKGWLNHREDKFLIHGVLAEVCRKHKDIQSIIQLLTNKFLALLESHNHSQFLPLSSYAMVFNENQEVNEPELSFRLASFSNDIGKFDDALRLFEKSRNQSLSLNDTINSTAVLSRIGEIYQAQGNFEQALKYFDDETKLFEELYEANPKSESLKNGLAISYEKLGEIYQAQGNFEQALKYFDERAKLGKELYEANPKSESLKNGLAISYSKLGSIYQAQGNFEQALKYFDDETKLFEELYEANPKSVGLLNGLAVSLYKLGSVYHEQSLNEEAMPYFVQCQNIWAVLAEQVPLATEYKSNLGFINNLIQTIQSGGSPK